MITKEFILKNFPDAEKIRFSDFSGRKKKSYWIEEFGTPKK